MAKVRLDRLLIEKGLLESRTKAQALIMAGRVAVDGQVVTKAGMQISSEAKITIEGKLPYVSRGGLKLAAALDAFGVNPQNNICADVGSSTGGFTDVLLQRGAMRVYAIDVGYGQLAWKLRRDNRVMVMERTLEVAPG
jgi:23S rRNA (cytidine1920-2'-O)/16S rRNA (cytidine1409-2'-O)-methyltransferase